MEGINVLPGFLGKVRHDPVIDTGHIALYMALFRCWATGGYASPVTIKRPCIMREAKISSSVTYFSKLKYLGYRGYIVYEPSHNGKTGSRVYLCGLDRVLFVISEGLMMETVIHIPKEEDVRQWVKESVKECFEEMKAQPPNKVNNEPLISRKKRQSCWKFHLLR